MTIGIVGQVGATFHVVDARSVNAVLFAANGKYVVDAADGVHRIHVTENQNARSVTAPGRARLQQVAEAVYTGNALHVCADTAHVVLNAIRHAIDGRRIVGW